MSNANDVSVLEIYHMINGFWEDVDTAEKVGDVPMVLLCMMIFQLRSRTLPDYVPSGSSPT